MKTESIVSLMVEKSTPDPNIPIKRGRGRPKGSKNKPKITTDPFPTSGNTVNLVKHGRGRPKGSKNKNTKPTFDKAKRLDLIKERWAKINEDVVPF